MKDLIPVSVNRGMHNSFFSLRKIIDTFVKRLYYFEGKPLHYFQLDDIRMPIFIQKGNYTSGKIYKNKVNEPGILRLLRSLLTKDSIMIDAGANVGLHSLYCSNFCKHVYAFEPITFQYEMLQSSILENNLTSITAYNLALGSEANIVPIYSNARNRGESSLNVTKKRKKLQDVQVVRLDDHFYKMKAARLDVMKIDVEGFELEVLTGAATLIDKWHPSIVMEFSPYMYVTVDSAIGKKILEFLQAHGYDIYNINAGDIREKILPEQFSDFVKSTRQTNLLCLYSQ